MSTMNIQTLKIWRWVFLVAETVVLVMLAFTLPQDLGARSRIGSPPEALQVVYGVSYIFLLVGSPFFFRRLRVLAVVGWIIALSLFIMSFSFVATKAHL